MFFADPREKKKGAKRRKTQLPRRRKALVGTQDPIEGDRYAADKDMKEAIGTSG